MVGWHHELNGHGCQQSPRHGEEQGSLVCCCPWSHRVRYNLVTELKLREAEDVKKRWQEYLEEIYKKDLHDPDNHNGVITHQEPDILEFKVKQTLGSITMNKANGGDGIPVEFFQILKDDAVRVLHSICLQFGKLSSGHRTEKRSVFHSNPKERQSRRMLKLPHDCTHLTR